MEDAEAPLALRASRPHAVDYIGGGDQEEGKIECPGRHRMSLSMNESEWNLNIFALILRGRGGRARADDAGTIPASPNPQPRTPNSKPQPPKP